MHKKSIIKKKNNSSIDHGKRPNVIVIIPHDLGDYLGCYGHNVSTPNIDQLAHEGVMFTNHFSTSSMCSPSRGSIITSKYPHTNGLMGLVNHGWDLPKYNITDAQRFREAGYRTYLIGIQHEKKLESDLGFNSYYLHHIVSNYSSDCIADILEQLLKNITAGKESILNNNKQPFYIRIGMSDVHRFISFGGDNWGYDWAHDRGIDESEVEIIPKWKDTPGLRYDLSGFTGTINNLDRCIGIIRRALEKYDHANDTIIIFTTDHGIDFPCAKGTLYDLGIHTGLIIWYPKRFKKGIKVNGLTSHIDILPTILDLCNIEENSTMQGKSLLPLIEGKEYEIHKEIFAEENTFPKNIIRCIRTKNLKFIWRFTKGIKSNAALCGEGRSVADTGRFYFIKQPEFELYDVTKDPYELNNLSGNDEFQKIEADLKQKLKEWMHKTKDPIIHGSINRPIDERKNIKELPECFQNIHFRTLWE